MSDHDSLDGFLGKWRAHWPEWAIAEVFLPAAQRQRAQAWFALRDELAEAAWGGQDPRPGEAKLGWWADELAGWSRGARRHPLGLVLQRVPAPWERMGAALPALRAGRDLAEADATLSTLMPYAGALAAVAQELFAAAVPAAEANVAASLLAERVLRKTLVAAPDGADARDMARDLLARWPAPVDGSRPGRIHSAIVRRRLQRLAQGRPPRLPRLAALATAWRAARG